MDLDRIWPLPPPLAIPNILPLQKQRKGDLGLRLDPRKNLFNFGVKTAKEVRPSDKPF
ncbi:hypothetical protein J6590_086391 [Homalodisca vitripennis]|nr:hypothetical protein J6590_086391 [Homalodisca vitripennis]